MKTKNELNLKWLVFLCIAFVLTALQVFTYKVVSIRTILGLLYFFFFLEAFRSTKKVWEFVVSAVAFLGSMFLARMFMFGINPKLALLALIELSIYTFFYLVTFIVDRICYKKLPPVANIFIFPTLLTIFVIVGGFFKLGNYVDPYYDIYNIRIIAQTSNLVFEYGLVFIISIIYTLIDYLINNVEKKQRLVSGVSLGVIIAFLFTYGGISMKVNAAEYKNNIKTAVLYTYETDFLAPKEKTFDESKVLFEREYKEAKDANVDLVITHEEYFACKLNEENDAINFVKAQINTYKIPTLMCFNLIGEKEGESKNAAVLFDKDGNQVFYYLKTQIIPIVESSAYVVGETDPAYGTINIKGKDINISACICADVNNPMFVAKMHKPTDLLIVPSWDFGNYSYIQKARSGFRAIENRVTMFKVTYCGLTYISDPAGNIPYEEYSMEKAETVSIINVPIAK